MSNQPLNVLFLSAWHPWPADNGVRIRVSQLLRAVAARHYVSLVTFSGEPGAPDAHELPIIGLCQQAVIVPSSAFTSTRLDRWVGLLSRTPSHLYAIPSAKMRIAAKTVLKERAHDVVIASTTAVAELATQLQVPRRILEEHNFLGRIMHDAYLAAASPSRRVRAWATWHKDIAWERRLFRRYDLVTMVSDADKGAVSAMGCATTRVEVVPNGVDAQACAAVRAEPVPHTLIYPGALTYAANLDAVQWFSQRIWPHVRAKQSEAKFLVTGRTEGVDSTVLAGVPGLHLTGYLADVRPTLAATQVCVIPLRIGGGSRLKVLEAMALGVPVVSTSKGIEGIAITPGRHCLVADDADAFAGQVCRLLDEPSLGRHLAAAARREVVPCYDWPPIAKRFVDLVEEVAAG